MEFDDHFHLEGASYAYLVGGTLVTANVATVRNVPISFREISTIVSILAWIASRDPATSTQSDAPSDAVVESSEVIEEGVEVDIFHVDFSLGNTLTSGGGGDWLGVAPGSGTVFPLGGGGGGGLYPGKPIPLRMK